MKPGCHQQPRGVAAQLHATCNQQSCTYPNPRKKSRPKTERAIEKKQVVLTDRTGHHQTVQRRKRSCSPVACNMQSAELRIPEPKKKIRSTTGGATEKRHVVSTGYENRMSSTAQRSCSSVACNIQSAELHISEPEKNRIEDRRSYGEEPRINWGHGYEHRI